MVRLQEQLETALDEAKDASLAKGSFLANMSHEIRTPMNAIIGMTHIAAKTEEVDKLKYCLMNIENSSTHLLSLINNILDMSKIEAGKLELDNELLSIEKMLIKVSNLIIDKIEQKGIKLKINLGSGMSMHYIGDELRLSQVITNLFSNAVKFTPEEGRIELTVNEITKETDHSILRFSVKDTGIGMTEEQLNKLFDAFAQAEKGTARKFGGTGLGLAISKSIVELMDGKIWAESEPGNGSEFIFEIKLQRPEQQHGPVIYGNIHPSDLKLLIIDSDLEDRKYFRSIINSFGITHADETDNVEDAVKLALEARDTQKPYDIAFADHCFADEKSLDLIKKSGFRIDRDNVVAMATFMNWNKIEASVHEIGIKRFISKPIFPSSVLDAINEVIGGAVKHLDIKTENHSAMPDFSDITLLLAEDVEINREIFSALLEETKANIEIAENGQAAVEKFKIDPDKYDMIIMDIQMPEMDGYEATLVIRSLELEKSKTIPIIAMTANVFKEDVQKCLDCGMNDHLAKPMEVDKVIDKITLYCDDKF
jgi:CheY-like chemotaxis protein